MLGNHFTISLPYLSLYMIVCNMDTQNVTKCVPNLWNYLHALVTIAINFVL